MGVGRCCSCLHSTIPQCLAMAACCPAACCWQIAPVPEPPACLPSLPAQPACLPAPPLPGCRPALPHAVPIDLPPAEENENMKELGKRLLKQENLPKFEPVDLTLDMLMAEGEWAGRHVGAGQAGRQPSA